VSETTTNLTEYIDENFGANASYVQGLLARFQKDPKSVDESWQTFFGDLLATNGQPAKAETRPAANAPAAEPTPKAAPKATPAVSDNANARPITGPAKKIVENMELSLSVPTATSVRSVPVKLLEENRRIINEHIQAQGRGKASFTHIIAWAIVQAAKAYPRMNHGYAESNGVPSRVENEHINIGIAIDIEKKDGSRNLLVPNIKNCEIHTTSNQVRPIR
jgi:2-oxoglutarate dehydrogenase E1 component